MSISSRKLVRGRQAVVSVSVSRSEGGVGDEPVQVQSVDSFYVMPEPDASVLAKIPLFFSNIRPPEGQLIRLLTAYEPCSVSASRGAGEDWGFEPTETRDATIERLKAEAGAGSKVYGFRCTSAGQARCGNAVECVGEWTLDTGTRKIKLSGGKPSWKDVSALSPAADPARLAELDEYFRAASAPSCEGILSRLRDYFATGQLDRCLVADPAVWDAMEAEGAIGRERHADAAAMFGPYSYFFYMEGSAPGYARAKAALSNAPGMAVLPSRQGEGEAICVGVLPRRRESAREARLIRESLAVVSEELDAASVASLGVPDSIAKAGNIYDEAGWRQLEAQGGVGGRRYRTVLGMFDDFGRVAYFRDRNNPAFAAAFSHFKDYPTFVGFDPEGAAPRAFAVGLDQKRAGAVVPSQQISFSSSADGVDSLDITGVDGRKLSFSVVPDKAEEEPKWNGGATVAPADSQLFGNSLGPKGKFVYYAHIQSMNRDPELEYDDQVVADSPRSLKEIFDELWTRTPAGYGVNKDMKIAHKEFQAALKAALSKGEGGDDDAQRAAVIEASKIPFPVVTGLFLGPPELGVELVPSKEMFDKKTAAGEPCGLFKSDDDRDPELNDEAKRIVHARLIIGGMDESREVDDEDIKPFFKESDERERLFLVDNIDFERDETAARGLASREGDAAALAVIAAEMDRADAIPMPAEVRVRASGSADDVKEIVLAAFNSLHGLDVYRAVNADLSEDGAQLDEDAAPAAPASAKPAPRIGWLPCWAIGYVTRGDRSDLTFGEARTVDRWLATIERLGYDAATVSLGEECEFSPDPEFGVPCDCVKFQVQPR